MDETRENSNSCPICYDNLTDVGTARPDVCDHVFCLKCLQRWGKHGSFCPVDRKRFKKIVNISNSTEIPVKPKKIKKQQVLYDVSSHCEVCKDTKNKEVLILCDCCDLAYHLTCLTPPLSEVPPGIWHCPECVAVAEKLKTNKGLVKGQQSIEKDHSNLKLLSSSSHKSFHETYQKYKNSKNNGLKFISRDKMIKEAKRSMNMLIRKSTPRTRSHSAYHEDVNKISPLSRNLRHRLERKKYFWDSSSEDSEATLSCESCSSNGEQEHISSKNDFLKTKNNREENLHDNSCVSRNDVPECSFLLRSQRKYSKQESSTSASSSKTFSASDFDFSRSLSTEKMNDNDCVSVIASMEYQNSDGGIRGSFLGGDPVSVDSTPCASALSLKEKDCNLVKTGNKSLKIDKFQIGHDLTPESEDLDDDITVIETVNKDPSIKELKGLYVSENISKSLIEESSNADGQILKGGRENIQNYSSKKTCSLGKGNPVFAVFGSLEDEDSSQKKYSELNLAKKKTCSNRHTNDSDILPRAFKHSSKISKRLSTDRSTKTHKLSKELKAIEKEKWKSRHSLSDKQQHSCKFQCCRGFGKNPYNSTDVVRVGKHFGRMKYSDSFKELQSIAKPLWQKTTYSESDIVILNKRNLAARCCSKEVKSEHLSDITYSCHPSTSSKADCIERIPNHEIISVDSESLLYLANHEENLLRSALCLANIKCLGFNKDGFLRAEYIRK